MHPSLVDRVLARFRLQAPPVSAAGAQQLFAAWCAHVSFDNVLKRIALAEHKPLPGLTGAHFFDDYLATGAGGTCWSTSGALCDLYCALGFRARRASAMMRADFTKPLTGAAGHGTVIVDVDGAALLADASILAGTLLPLIANEETRGGSALIPLVAEPHQGKWRVRFRSGHVDTPMWCELLELHVDDAFFRSRHEASRTESGFNARLTARKNQPHDDCIVVVRGGKRYVRTLDGIASEALDAGAVPDVLARDFGIDRDIALRIPPDAPPDPPA